MRPFVALPLLALLLGCGRTVEVSGTISSDGRCDVTIDGTHLSGPDNGVRVLFRPLEGVVPERHVLVVYCSLTGPDTVPARFDFVKLNAPEAGVLDTGTYTIDPQGELPRSIGVVVTAPDHLDGTRHWEPTSGTFQVLSATRNTVDAEFTMELRARGERGY
jgi:hypothetical protein